MFNVPQLSLQYGSLKRVLPFLITNLPLIMPSKSGFLFSLCHLLTKESLGLVLRGGCASC